MSLVCHFYVIFMSLIIHRKSMKMATGVRLHETGL